MNKKVWILIWSAIVWATTIAAPISTVFAFWESNVQNNMNIAWSKSSWWSNELITFVQNAVNWILWLLGLISIIILIWGGFQMITAAWDDGKYKKWFTIVKQAVIWLILIWSAWMIVSLVFSFMNTTATTGSTTTPAN